jgi:hypothetical protein
MMRFKKAPKPSLFNAIKRIADLEKWRGSLADWRSVIESKLIWQTTGVVLALAYSCASLLLIVSGHAGGR